MVNWKQRGVDWPDLGVSVASWGPALGISIQIGEADPIQIPPDAAVDLMALANDAVPNGFTKADADSVPAGAVRDKILSLLPPDEANTDSDSTGSS